MSISSANVRPSFVDACTLIRPVRMLRDVAHLEISTEGDALAGREPDRERLPIGNERRFDHES